MESNARYKAIIIQVTLKRDFIQYQKDILQKKDASGATILSGTNSTAADGNIMEAINLALNPFDKHYIDRDLSRTV